ncbi:MAG: hypothetical protein ACRC5T_09040 [Cetobacterium sp.]
MCKKECYHLTVKTDTETGDTYYWCSAKKVYTDEDSKCGFQED